MSDHNNIFYVYLHRKVSDNNIFYVGKGSKNRHSRPFGRSEWWKRIADKHGFYSEMLIENISEELAHLIEIEVIDKYKYLGHELCNITLGGEGVRVENQTPESNEKRSNTLKGRVFDKDHLDKISKALKGRVFSDDHKSNLRKSALAQSKQRSDRLLNGNSPACRDDVKAKISATLTGRKHNDEFKKKRSDYMKKKNPMASDESRLRHLESMRKAVRPRGTCPHCGIETLLSHLNRWHFDKCKHKAAN